MVEKKGFLEDKSSIKKVIIALSIAVILLLVELIRWIMQKVLMYFNFPENLVYVTTLLVALLVIIFFIKVFIKKYDELKK